MDIADINKVANRKRINAEAEVLREKLSRETQKIVKLRVAQDTAYWDLKEKLHQLENNHERLQQNMVEVQMQHETLSGQYQEELRLRPETLNKVNSTREICNVLETYSERLKETLSRCKADQATLCEAYQKSGNFVRDIKQKQSQMDEKNAAVVKSLEEKVKMLTEHSTQMKDYFNAAKRQCDDELRELKAKLETAYGQRDELVKAQNDMARNLDMGKMEIEKRDNHISALQNETKRLLQEFNTVGNEMKNTINKQEKELKETTEAAESLKRALTNQEDFNKSICQQNSELNEKLASMEVEETKLEEQVRALTMEIEELNISNASVKNELSTVVQANNALQGVLGDKDQEISTKSSQIEDLKLQLQNLENEKVSLKKELSQLTEHLESHSVKIKELQEALNEGEKKMAEMETMMQDAKQSYEEKTTDLTNQIETKTNECNSQGMTIIKLMDDINICVEKKSRVELALEKCKKERDNDMEKAKEVESGLIKKIEVLESQAKDKEQELSKQMSIILEIRGEKEKLKEKIRAMQDTIDNIQKTLIGRPPPDRSMERPELDDNANMSPCKPLPPPPPKAMLRHPEPIQYDPMVFNILNDSSNDGSVKDPSEVNRRYQSLSRGERSPMVRPLSSVKRKRPLFKINDKEDEHDQMSLAQLKAERKVKERLFFKSRRTNEGKQSARNKF